VTTGFHLLDHPNPNAKVNHDGTYWGYAGRNLPLSGGLGVHTAEGALDAIGVDSGAENVAAYFTHSDRPASYHDLHDSDSDVALLPWTHTAFHVARRGVNSHTVGQSFATKAAQWGQNPDWDDKTLRRGAAKAAEFVAHMADKGITVPLRRLTAAEVDARRPGLFAHGDMQADRTDPGWGTRQWDRYFDLIRQAQQKDTVMATALGSLDLVEPAGPGKIRVAGWTGEPSKRVGIWAADRHGQDVKLNGRSSFVATGDRADLPDGAKAFAAVLDVPYLFGDLTIRASIQTDAGWRAPRFGLSPAPVTIDPAPSSPASPAFDTSAIARHLDAIATETARARELIQT
jgi:hypothetical protein